MTLRQTHLRDQHLRCGAKLGEFAGWELPLQYETGTLAEHQACRSDAAAFDVSHLGTLDVAGPGALDALQWCFTNDLNRIAPGQAQYTHLLDAEAGWVIDDIIVWWLDGGDFKVLPNASNTEAVAAALRDSSSTAEVPADWDISVHDVTGDRALIALQGPQARRRLAQLSTQAAEVGRFAVTEFEFSGARCFAAGTGYTGEDGVECDVPAEAAPQFWEQVVSLGFTPAGLAARDVLRLEAGFPLHGHDLGPDITPLNARLNWVVGWKKDAFQGKAALQAQKDAGVERRLLGLQGRTRRPLRDGQPVYLDGTQVGSVTSGGYSPALEQGIALAMLEAEVPLGAEVAVSEKMLAADVVKPPFVPLA